MSHSSSDDVGAVFAAKRDEVAAALAAALAEAARMRAEVAEAKRAADAAARRFDQISYRANRAVPQTAEGVPLAPVAPAIEAIIDEARRERDAVAGRHSRLKAELGNVLWRCECLRADLEQIDRAITPPPLGGALPEVIKRPPPGPREVETIVWPGGQPEAA